MILDRILSIINNVSGIFNVIDTFQSGTIALQHGKNVIEIFTRREPIDLYLSFKESSGMPVCNGEIDKVGYTLTPTGFILYADVESEFLQLEYEALFAIKN